MQTIGGLAGRDPNSHNKFMTDNYLNSGVLVMNLIYLHNVNFMDKCISFLKQYATESGYMGQDAINNSLDQKAIVNIGSKYNMLSRDKTSVANAVIFHYAGQKPWSFWRKWSPAKFVYYKLRVYCWISFYFNVRSNNLKLLVDFIFSALEFISFPFTYLLNLGHDINFKRRMSRKRSRNN